MKKAEWIHGNKQRIETPCKTFNSYCVCLIHGNHLGPGHTSLVIRPWNDVECTGITYDKGHLQNFDLKCWRQNGLPRKVDEFIVATAKDKPVYLNEFYHRRKGKKIVHGYIVTGNYDENYKHLRTFYTNNTQKSYGVLDWCRDYISNMEDKE